ncbi:MAG: class I SAM-dependent methyltransferase [Syntrophomonadaceae bacterium]|nr:class I SAM-dependent methyltransferase [Syntrophomonadaceae bacterium]
MLEHIPCRGSLCDVGCGAGLIDYELAPHFESITCVDVSRDAVASVEQGAKRRGIKNISTRCMDADKLDGQWDTVLALFYGGTDFFAKYYPLAKDRLILATHGARKANFGPDGRKIVKCFDVAGVKQKLDELGVKYGLWVLEMEYGQPLTSLPEAEAFVKAYSMPMEQAELDEYLQAKLVSTGDEKFPYYLPNLKKFGVFVIRKDENGAV